MGLELRVAGRAPVRYDHDRDAMAAARAILRDDPNIDVELFDQSTGAPYAPGASRAWRDELWNTVGY